MENDFDPYYKWLGIPPRDQPPNHYRLLGIELFESDREVIDAAANRVMGYLKDLAVGDDAQYSQKLLNEVARARLCLLNRQKKFEHDAELRAKTGPDDRHGSVSPSAYKAEATSEPAGPPPAESAKPVAVQIQTTKPGEAVKKLGQAPSQPLIFQGSRRVDSEPVPFFPSPGATKPASGKRDSAKVRPAAAPRRTAKRGTNKPAATGGAGAKRMPTRWIVLGVSGGSALGLMILLFSLLGGPSADSPARPGERSASVPVTGPRTLPTFQSDLPTFQSDLPTDRSVGGVRPMDAAEKARRKERIASFAEMAREQEAELREEQPQRKP
jgi:hypothetical protein